MERKCECISVFMETRAFRFQLSLEEYHLHELESLLFKVVT